MELSILLHSAMVDKSESPLVDGDTPYIVARNNAFNSNLAQTVRSNPATSRQRNQSLRQKASQVRARRSVQPATNQARTMNRPRTVNRDLATAPITFRSKDQLRSEIRAILNELGGPQLPNSTIGKLTDTMKSLGDVLISEGTTASGAGRRSGLYLQFNEYFLEDYSQVYAQTMRNGSIDDLKALLQHAKDRKVAIETKISDLLNAMGQAEISLRCSLDH